MYIAKVTVQYQESILNPAARAAEEAGNRLEGEVFSDLAIGKVITFKVDVDDVDAAREAADRFAQKVLVNRAMEDYTLEVEEENL